MSYGKMAVDWEDRVNFDKLRKDRIENANKAMHNHGIGSAIIYHHDMKRYLSSHWCHPYSRHVPHDFNLLIRDAGFPYVHRAAIDPPGPSWLKDKHVGDDVLTQPSVLVMTSDEVMASRWKKSAQQVKTLLKKHGVADLPTSVDYSGTLQMKALQDEGIEIVNGNVWQQEARLIKTDEEIELQRMASSCNEAGYAALTKVLRAGMRECDAQAVMVAATYQAGAEYIEGWVTASGIRHSPRRYNWSDRTIRPGELFPIEMCHATFCGYKTCQDRTFLVGAPPTEIQQEMYQLIADVQTKMGKTLRPGITTHDAVKARAPLIERDLKSLENIRNLRSKLVNHFGGMGISHNEAPICSLSEPPVVLRKNMVIAHALSYWVENYQGVGIENTYRITDTGTELLTVFPYEELMVCGYP